MTATDIMLGLMPSCVASFMAMGNIRAAAALLVRTSDMRAVTRYTPARAAV
jgi:hypothetical protein